MSRLRVAGIAARVDRGLWGAAQVPLAKGQLTVYVAEPQARRAAEILGTPLRDATEPGALFRVLVGLLALALAVAMVAVVISLLR